MVQELNRIPWPGWEKVKAIGEGAFGTVYEIRHDLIHSEERAALKVLSIPRSQGVIKSMRAEGQDEASITQSIMDQAGTNTPAHTMLFSVPVSNVAGLRSVTHE